MHEMGELVSQLDIETDVMDVRKKDADHAGNDRNIKGKVKLYLNIEQIKIGMNKQTNKQTKGQRMYPITRSDNVLWK
jgi:hypothetical protein